MKFPLQIRVPIAWSLLVLVVCIGAVVILKVVLIDAPPSGEVIITSNQELDTAANLVGVTPDASHDTSQADGAGPTETPSVGAASPSVEEDQALGPAPPTTPELIAIYVSGAVLQPGVYTLPVGSRVGDAVSAAGGPESEADLNAINLAARLSDEEHVLVPRMGDTAVSVAAQPTTPPSQPQPQDKTTPSGKININTASEDELQRIPGIGPAISTRIITYRETYGPFPTIEDIMRVPGIKEATFSKIQDYITVGP